MSHPQDFIKTMTEHTSIRRYTEAPVTDEERSAVEDAVRAASSSCFLQLVSVVRITDPALRDAFARLSGNQPHVKSAPEFWVFCADLSRDVARCPDAKTGWTEQLVMGVHDVGIAAQNAMTALEALGLGGVFVGGIRNGIAEADRCHVLGIEDSGAGVCSVRLAGYVTIGFDGGNINDSGTRALCNEYFDNFDQILQYIKKVNG